MSGDPVSGGAAVGVRDALRAPGLPGVRTALRTALVELWFHPWPALAANVVWTGGVLVVVALVAVWPLGALLAAPLLALPVAGMAGLGARIVRGMPVDVHDGFAAWRSHGRPALLLGTGAALVALVLGIDLVLGIGSMGGPVGWALATGAIWALAGGWAVMLITWPLLLDPAAGRSLSDALRLAVRLAMLFPARTVALTVAATVVLIVATVLFAALATFAVAYVLILAAVVVLPAADRLDVLEGRR